MRISDWSSDVCSSDLLSSVRLITSTGSPLGPEGFDYVYRHIKNDVCLSSIAGGTDIISCFVGGNPIGPVWPGEIQRRCLGMAVEVFNDHGRPVRGEEGELVRSEAHTSELQSLMRLSYAVFCLTTKTTDYTHE